MKVVFMGTAAFAVPALRAVKAAGHEVALVVCQPDRHQGRGQHLHAPPLKEAALELGLEVFQPEKIKEAAAVERLRSASCDVLCVVAYGQILPQAVLDLPRLMPLNVHGSLLPKYRGAAPIEWAVAMGEAETGVCVQKMAYKLDSGDLLLSEAMPLSDADDATSITPRLSEMGAALLVQALKKLSEGGPALLPQDEAAATFAPLLKKSHGSLDFKLSASELRNRFRGFKARPGVHSALGGETIKIHDLRAGEPAQAEAGTLLAIEARGLQVACGAGGSVWLKEVQSAGGKAMPAADWSRGRKAQVGDRFQDPVF